MVLNWLNGLRSAWDAPRVKRSRRRTGGNVIGVERLESRTLLSAVLSDTSTLNYTENAAAAVINPLLTITDPQNPIDPTLASATITITNFVDGQDVLGFASDGMTMGNIIEASNANGSLTLTSPGGTATLAEWQAALRSVTYANSSNNPDTTPRNVEFVVFENPGSDFAEPGQPGQPGDTAIRTGFDSLSLPANDDSSQLTPLGFTVNFFGVQYDSVYVNNNGNLTFDAPLAQYTPFDLLSTNVAIIAPFFADVDTRQGNVVTYGQGTIDGHQAFAVNYIDVRHFNASGDPMAGLPTNSFQVVLIDRSDIAPGDFDIEFNYGNIAWEAGTASGSDAAGLGGTAVRAGFSNGVDTAFEIPGSAINGAFLDSGPPDTSLVHNSFNSTVSGRYVFETRNGSINVGAASAPLASTVNITVVNDPPATGAGFVIQGGGQAFVPADQPLTAIVSLTASDPDTPPDQLVYTVSNVRGGRFVLLPDRDTPITSFTQADVDAGRVAFVFADPAVEPTFDLTVSDGTAGLPSMSVEAESPAPLTESALVDGVLYVVGSPGKDVVHIKQKGDKIVVKFKGGDTIKKDVSDVDEIVLMLNGGADEVKISKKVNVDVTQQGPVNLRVSPISGTPSPDGSRMFSASEDRGLSGPSSLGAGVLQFPLLGQLSDKIFADTDWLAQV